MKFTSVLSLLLVASSLSTSHSFSTGRSNLYLPNNSATSKANLSIENEIQNQIKSKSVTELNMSSLSGGASDGPIASIKSFTKKNSFLLGMAVAVLMAKAFPSVSNPTMNLKQQCQRNYNILIHLLSKHSLESMAESCDQNYLLENSE